MGAVAVFYFFAAAFVMAVACSGPDIRAKFCSAYLMGAWAMTNNIWLDADDPNQALELFMWPDGVAAAIMLAVLVLWPTRWLAIVLAALSTQVIFQAYHALQDPLQRQAGPANWVNELLFDVQLLAVCIPTAVQTWRRFRPRPSHRPAKAVIRPPYPGWSPPDGL